MVVYLFVCYFISLLIFCLLRHPVYYCILLIFKALLCSLMCYIIYGFSWYSLLLCLVYIGGVYILFVFVSVHRPNSRVLPYMKLNSWRVAVLSMLACFFGLIVAVLSVREDYSRFLCNIMEGYMYICMCLTLLFGFIVLSVVMRVKLNHYR